MQCASVIDHNTGISFMKWDPVGQDSGNGTIDVLHGNAVPDMKDRRTKESMSLLQQLSEGSQSTTMMEKQNCVLLVDRSGVMLESAMR